MHNIKCFNSLVVVKLQTQLQFSLYETQPKNKEGHIEHRVDCTFLVGNLCGLGHTRTGPRTSNPIKYGSLTIVEQKGENAFKLELLLYENT